MSTIENFVADWTSKPVDTDGIYPNQCMDLMHEYCQEVLGLDTQILSVPAAYLLYSNFPLLKGSDKFELIQNTITGVPNRGDIVIFSQQIGLNGHVAIFLEGDATTFKSFDANWPIGSLPHIQSHDYKGVLGWLRYKTTPTTGYKYKIGDILEPSIDIPVYPRPEGGQSAYGKIGFNFQAKVIGMQNGYYNVDQSLIPGGGTGWVFAATVDSVPPFIARNPSPSMPPPKTYTEEQYTTLLEERDQAVGSYTSDHNQLVEAQKTLSMFKAMGIEKPEDVTKLKSDYDKTIQGLNLQLLQVLGRNKKLADLIKDKEDEDYTAIEEGIKAVEKVNDLEYTVTQAAKHLDTKPDAGSIVQKIWDLVDISKKGQQIIDQYKREELAQKEDPLTNNEKFGINWLMTFFGLSKGV